MTDKSCIKEEDNEKILDLENFDENDLEQFTTKVVFICEGYFGFRLIQEHTDLMTNHLENK